MTIWKNSKMTTLYYSNQSASLDYPCVVKIDEKEILIEYEDEGIKQYHGLNDGTGHFILHAPDINGKGSLHMFPGATLLQGSWIEAGERGMWSIKLE